MRIYLLEQISHNLRAWNRRRKIMNAIAEKGILIPNIEVCLDIVWDLVYAEEPDWTDEVIIEALISAGSRLTKI